MGRNVLIVGGGLTGLAAAWALEQERREYTLIEVKARLGGGIVTVRDGDWILDGGAFVHEQYAPWSFLEPLGLSDALIPLAPYRDGQTVVFREGTQSLIDALAAQLKHGSILKRMAVSSIGRLVDGQCAVCLENGTLLHADSVIVTAPARYAAHMLWTLDPEIAMLLDDYQYDAVARVSLGYAQADVPQLTPNVDDWRSRLGLDARIKFMQSYTIPARFPEGGVLLRAGVRLEGAFDRDAAINMVREAARPLIGDAVPQVAQAHYWPENDPLTRHLPEHAAIMAAIRAKLPPNVALVGSDYDGARIDQRVSAGREAAGSL